MQIQQALRTVETEGLEHEQKSFTVSQNKRMFEILSSNIYSDKPLAVVREYGCNAYDAHVAAGKEDVPFEVHLPNDFEPWFAVKDFGTGLSHEDVMELYSTYGLSTKSSENRSIGMLGLGSKSGFAYSDQFTVISRFNGTVSTYSAFISPEGVPTITLLHSDKTSEENGLEVNIPVKSADFTTFASRAKQVFFRFKTQPIIVGNTIDLNKAEYLMEGPNFKIRTNNFEYWSDHSAYAVQGSVAYYIDVNAFTDDFLSDVERSFLRNSPVDIYFDIGKLDVSASREGLNYDKITQANIKEEVGKIIEHVTKQFGDIFTNCKTKWEAVSTYAKWQQEQSHFMSSLKRNLDIKFSFKGEEIDERWMDVKTWEYVDTLMDAPDPMDNTKTIQVTTKLKTPFANITSISLGAVQYLVNGNEVRRKALTQSDSERIFPLKDVIIVFQDSKLKRPYRSICLMFAEKESEIIVISDYTDKQKVLDALGNPPDDVIYYTSNYEEPPPAPAKKRSEKKTIKEGFSVTSFSAHSFSLKEKKVDLEKGGKYMILYNRNLADPKTVHLAGDDVRTPSSLCTIMWMLDRLGICKTNKITLFNSTHKKAVLNDPKWVSAYDEYIPLLNKLASDTLFQKSLDYFCCLQDNYSRTYSRQSIISYFEIAEEGYEDLKDCTDFVGPYQIPRYWKKVFNDKLGANVSIRFLIDNAIDIRNMFTNSKYVFSTDEIPLRGSYYEDVDRLELKDLFRENYPLIYKLTKDNPYGFEKEIKDYIKMCNYYNKQKGTNND